MIMIFFISQDIEDQKSKKNSLGNLANYLLKITHSYDKIFESYFTRTTFRLVIIGTSSQILKLKEQKIQKKFRKSEHDTQILC